MEVKKTNCPYCGKDVVPNVSCSSQCKISDRKVNVIYLGKGYLVPYHSANITIKAFLMLCQGCVPVEDLSSAQIYVLSHDGILDVLDDKKLSVNLKLDRTIWIVDSSAKLNDNFWSTKYRREQEFYILGDLGRNNLPQLLPAIRGEEQQLKDLNYSNPSCCQIMW